MKIYLTKHVLSRGIIEAEATEHPDPKLAGTMIVLEPRTTANGMAYNEEVYYGRSSYVYSRVEAEIRMQQVRARRLAQLRAEVQALEEQLGQDEVTRAEQNEVAEAELQ